MPKILRRKIAAYPYASAGRQVKDFGLCPVGDTGESSERIDKFIRGRLSHYKVTYGLLKHRIVLLHKINILGVRKRTKQRFLTPLASSDTFSFLLTPLASSRHFPISKVLRLGLPAVVNRLVLEKRPDLLGRLVAQATEDRQLLRWVVAGNGGVIQRPVFTSRGERESGTVLLRYCTHAHNDVEPFAYKLFERFWPLSANVDAKFGHDRNRKRMHPRSRARAGATNVPVGPAKVPPQSFGDLRSRDVAGTYNEHATLRH
jgi:hypothetical protein